MTLELIYFFINQNFKQKKATNWSKVVVVDRFFIHKDQIYVAAGRS